MKQFTVFIGFLAAASLASSLPPNEQTSASTRSQSAQPKVSQLAVLFNDWANGTVIPYKLFDIVIVLILYMMWVLFATMITTNASGRRSAASLIGEHSPATESTSRWVFNALDNWLDHLHDE